MSKSKWQTERAKKIVRMRRPKTQRGWLCRWETNLKVIRDKATDLWADRQTYKDYRDIILSNPHLDKTADFFNLVDRMYLSHVLIAIRTFDDTDLRSYSLLNFLEEIRDNASQLTKTWFVARFRRNREMGERQFREHWGGETHIDEGRVDRDLHSLLAFCRRVRKAANKHLAHNAKRKPSRPLTYGEVDDAIDGIFQLTSDYNALIFNASWGTPSIP